MIKSEKRLKELAGILQKGNPVVVTEAIKILRDEEPFEGAIALLAEYYNNASDKENIEIIEEFFNDIKYHSVRPEVIAEILKPYKQDTICMLVSSCWQSGLDYSGYIEDIAGIFLESDYATAIECMTLIEESVKYNTREEKDNIIKIIEKSPRAFTHERNALTRELIEILEK
ncbi:MAG TPA: hypothetical protein DDW27_09365 [Bacteroidales bacterium]|nr:hypothetical protein [Bacteroidales bacterium]